MTGTIALSLIGRIGLIDMSYLILDSAMVFKKFQVGIKEGFSIETKIKQNLLFFNPRSGAS